MAQCGAQLDPKICSCFFCLDLLKEPVTTSCGHTYCMKCLQHHWDAEEEEKRVYSCPQCDRTFTVRPVLEKNTMLAALVEKTGLQAASAEPSSPGAEYLTCDVCTETKLKAIKSCLICRASFCDSHLQPHRDAAPLQRHKLVEPFQALQENICLHHDEVMKLFCFYDLQFICHLCYFEKHEGHAITTVVALDIQMDLAKARKKIQQKTLSNTVVVVVEPELEPEPKSREDFLKYSCQITLDPNTANKHLLLSEGNRKVTFTEEVQPYCDHPDRFTAWPQVLSRESLTGRCYWEVEWTGDWGFGLAMTYRQTRRKGKSSKETKFNQSVDSWTIYHSPYGWYSWSEGSTSNVFQGCPTSRMGVYLDYKAGLLSFYSISIAKTMKLLHKAQSTFTQPLYAGIWICCCSSAEIVEL